MDQNNQAPQNSFASIFSRLDPVREETKDQPQDIPKKLPIFSEMLQNNQAPQNTFVSLFSRRDPLQEETQHQPQDTPKEMDQNNQVPQSTSLNPIREEPQDQLQDISTKWTKFVLNIRDERNQVIKLSSMILMGDHLIFLSTPESYSRYEAHLIAVDLRDISVQQTRISGLKNFNESGGTPQYTLEKYKENQIILFDFDCRPHMITIESFQPLSAKGQSIDFGEKPFGYAKTQIYKDGFIAYETIPKNSFPLKSSWCKLWHFDLQNQTWKAYEATGEAPSYRMLEGKSFMSKEGIYVYGDSLNEIFVLNLETMEWRRFQQETNFSLSGKFAHGTYKEDLIIFRCTSSQDKKIQVFCWNPATNSWKIFNNMPSGVSSPFNKLMMYKNSLWLGGPSAQGLELGTCNLLDNILEAPLSPEEQHLQSLFMSETESDIKFKVQDKIIPAHKEVLIKKSRFFEGLFKSGMAETKQDVIEIEDCDSVIFQEFLRFIYSNKFQFDDEMLTFKLFDFADKHLQNNLKTKCLDYLNSKVNSKTVFPLFEEACARNFQSLKAWCTNHLRASLSLAKISEIIQFVDRKQNDFSVEFIDLVLDWIMENYFEIYHKQNQSLRVCEDFLVKNVERRTIGRISQFVGRDGSFYSKFRQSYYATITQENQQERIRQGEVIFGKETAQLRSTVFCFMQENWEGISQATIPMGLPQRLYMDFISSILKNQRNEEAKQDHFEKDEKEENVRKTRRCEHCEKETE